LRISEAFGIEEIPLNFPEGFIDPSAGPSETQGACILLASLYTNV